MTDRRAWPADLTPARPRGRRPAAVDTPGSQPEALHLGDLVEAINKIADQLRRVEAKIDVLDERLSALIQPMAPTTAASAPKPPARRAAAPSEAPRSATARARRRMTDAGYYAAAPAERVRRQTELLSNNQPPGDTQPSA